MKKYFLLCLTFTYLVSSNLFAQEKEQVQESNLTVVAVGEATLEKDKMIFQDPYFQSSVSSGQKAAANEFVALLRNDFSFYQKKFFLVEAGANNTSTRPSTNYDYWGTKGVRFLGTVQVEKGGDGIKLNVTVEDIKQKKLIYTSATSTSITNLRKTGHEIANNIYKQIVGKESIFKSKIIFVSDRNSKGSKTVKEVYLMDFDGKNVTQLTTHGGIAISPALSHDGSKLVYSLISNNNGKRSNQLYLMNLASKEAHVISQKEGINSGAIFLPDGNLALTLTFTGNAEIYEMNIEGKTLRKMTNHFSSDVDPSITFDGKLMSFLSDRSGRAMIYTMDPNGTEKDVKRISFVGQFNATPRFSPDGKEIVFSSWLDRSFDLFRIGSDGTNLIRLTKEFGSNEEPSYSNDGEFIAFTSERVLSRTRADKNIYIMDRDGEILGPITQGFGNCISPRWYNY